MGRPPKVKAPPVAAARPPLMKYAEAVKLADKNARTIMKISQLMVLYIKHRLFCSLNLLLFSFSSRR